MTLQLALACFAEYVLHLTRLNPDMMYLHRDCGLLNVSYFKFDIDDAKGIWFALPFFLILQLPIFLGVLALE